jgi:hypothetical protein
LFSAGRICRNHTKDTTPTRRQCDLKYSPAAPTDDENTPFAADPAKVAASALLVAYR